MLVHLQKEWCNIAAKAISRMKLGQIDDYTANIGKFHGGSATNIVADEVVLGS